MNKIKVSVIIPVYNVENYLTVCIKSVMNQSLKEIELIVVNDGSTDNSKKIIDEFAKKYSNIRVIHQNNTGQGKARNNALDIAAGKYVYFLDSDDFIEVDTLEKLYNEAERNELDLVLFDGITFCDENIKIKNKNSYIKKGNYPEIMKGPEMFSQLIYNGDYTCSPCLIFIKRSVLDNKRIRFYEGIIQEDELFTFQLLLQCNRVKCIPSTFFHRRIREDSTMTGKNYLKSFKGYNTVLIKVLEFKKTLDCKDDYINNAINIAIGRIFAGAINRYCYMSNSDRREYSKDVNELRKVAKSFAFFGKKRYVLFYYLTNLYPIIKKINDKFI